MKPIKSPPARRGPPQPDEPSAHDVMREMEQLLGEYQSFVKHVIELLDTLARWQDKANEADAERLARIRRRGFSALLQHGIRPTASVGTPVDLAHHEVLDVREVDGVEADTIVEVVEDGYEMKVAGGGSYQLRCAKVIIAAGPNAVENTAPDGAESPEDAREAPSDSQGGEKE